MHQLAIEVEIRHSEFQIPHSKVLFLMPYKFPKKIPFEILTDRRVSTQSRVHSFCGENKTVCTVLADYRLARAQPYVHVRLIHTHLYK